MSDPQFDPEGAVRELDELIAEEAPFDEKAERVLELGERVLGVENAHLTRIEPEYDYWKSILSTDPPDGTFPAGIVMNLEDTYCHRTIQEGTYTFNRDQVRGDGDGLGAYLGIALGHPEQLGTICFVSQEPRQEEFDATEMMFAELIARRLETELLRERAEAQLRRLDEFTRTLSHDLRNPLSVAKGRLELLEEETGSEHYEPIERSLERMESMIEEVLAWARESQEIEDLQPARLSDLFESAWANVETASASYRVIDDLTFYASRDRVMRLFENLIRNAVEHGGSDVTVTVGRTDDGQGFFLADDGPGIPAADRDRVFEAGFSTATDGSGLGLSIVEAIATGHQWGIDIEESEHGGVRFTFENVIVDPEEA